VDDNVSLPEDSIDYIISAATLTANDTDDQTPNTSLAVSLVGGTTVTTAHGSVTFKANPSPGRFEYTPVGNYSGLDSFQYRVTDGGALSANATVNLTITPLNDAPVVGNIPNQTITEGGTFATITLDNYVTDVDNLASEMTWSYSGNTALTVSIVSRVATISTPNADWNGAETITFTATDPGLLSGSDPATFTVTAVNDPPVLAAIGDKPINELAQLTFTATATDPESPPEILTFSLDSGAPAGASVTAGGDFTWTPTEADGPGVYSITVRVTDNGSPVLSDSETIQVTVAEVNAAPTLDPVGNKTIDELTLLSFAAVGHDTDVPAQTLTYSLVGAPTGTAINPATGAFTWTPTEAQGPSPTVNDYTFDVCVSDTVAVPTCETIKVTVNEVNVAPVLTAIGNKTIDELALFTYQAAATDADLPSNTLTFSLDPGAPAGAGITAGGVLTWTPTEAQGPGVYPITVRVTDSGTPALDDFETIQVTVNEINAAPTAVTDSVTILEDSGVVIITPLTNDTDPDLPLNTLSLKGIGSASKGTPSIPFGTNTISYTPGLNQNGSDTFSYTIQDNGVPPLQAEGTVNITITPVTDAPIGSAQAVTFNEDSFYTFGAGNFPLTDPSDTPENVLAGVKITTLPAKGTLTLGASAVTAGQLIPLASLPQLKFTPAANEFGTPYTTFTFQVQDNGGTADSGVDLDVTPRVFTINVTSLPDLVVGGADTYIINKSKTFPFTVAAPGVLANDTDGDGSDFTLSTTLSKDGDFGTVVLSANGSFTYTQDSPKDNYTDTFKYILHDTYPVQDVEVTVTLIIDQTPPPKTAEWVLPYPYQNAVYIGTSETVELKVVLPSLTGMDHVEFWYWDHTGNPQKYVFIGKDTTPESSGGQYYFSTLLNMNTLPIGVDFQVFARTYDAAGNYITQDLDPAYLSRLLVTHNPSKVFLPLIMR